MNKNSKMSKILDLKKIKIVKTFTATFRKIIMIFMKVQSRTEKLPKTTKNRCYNDQKS